MAKGFKQGGFDILVWEIFRGAGRQTGRELAKGFEKQVKKRTIDSDSSHRKLVNRFNLPGTFKGASSKMYTLIDSFYNEYVTTKALFQASIYLQDDIDYIERKLEFVSRLIFSEAEERAYDRLLTTWTDYKEQAKNKK
jgi:hypothetical protein